MNVNKNIMSFLFLGWLLFCSSIIYAEGGAQIFDTMNVINNEKVVKNEIKMIAMGISQIEKGKYRITLLLENPNSYQGKIKLTKGPDIYLIDEEKKEHCLRDVEIRDPDKTLLVGATLIQFTGIVDGDASYESYIVRVSYECHNRKETKQQLFVGTMSDLKISDDLKMQSPADGEYMLKLENLSGKDISIDDISVASDCLNLSDTAFGIELGKDKFYTATFKFVPAMTKNGVCSEYLTITYKVAGDDLAKAIIVPIEITYHPKKWYKSSKKVTRIVGGTLIALSVADKWFKTPSGKKTVRYVANKLAGDDGDDGDDGSGGGFDTRRFAGDLVRAVNDFGEGVVQRIEAFEENAGDEIDNHTAQLKDLQDKVDRLEYERTLAEERNKFKKEMKREIEKFENIPFVAEQPKVVVTVGPLPVIQLVEERHIEITPFVQQQEQSKVVIPVEPLPIIQQVEEQPVVKKKFTDELTQAKSKIKNIYIKTGTVREKENCDGQVIFHLTDGNTIKYKEGEVNVVWVVEAPQVNPPSKWDSMVGDISRVKSDIKNFYTKALNTIEDFAKDPHIFFPAATVVTDFFMNKVSNKKVVKKQGIGRTIYNLLLPFVQGGFPMERSDWN